MDMTSIDRFIVVAYVKGLVSLDDKYLIVTPEGKQVMESISLKCLDIMDEFGQDTASAASELSKMMGKTVTRTQMLNTVFIGMFGNEHRVLAFLLYEQDSDYKFIRQTSEETAMKEGFKFNKQTKPDLKVVKKPKLDS